MENEIKILKSLKDIKEELEDLNSKMKNLDNKIIAIYNMVSNLR